MYLRWRFVLQEACTHCFACKQWPCYNTAALHLVAPGKQVLCT